VFGVNAAACLFTRAMIEAMPDQRNGFFDERFYMYYEDVDVAFRSLLAGWDAWFVPSAIAYHMGSVSAKKKASSYSPRMVARNQSAVIVKNAPWPLVWRCLMPAAHGVLSFLRGVARDLGARAALRTAVSMTAGWLRLPLYARSRRHIQAARVLDTNYLLRIMRHDGILG
jgi:GT2 family glycosyltransferase